MLRRYFLVGALLSGCVSDGGSLTGAGGGDGQGGAGGDGGSGGSDGAGASGGTGTGGAQSGGTGGSQDAAPPKDGPPSSAFTCSPARPGKSGSTNGLSSPPGIVFNIRTPSAYKPTQGSPLVVVFPPSGGDENITESYTGLTPLALARGYIIAYTDHRPPMLPGVQQQQQVVKKIFDDWCVDPARVYLTGHSDGGTVANRIAISVKAAPLVAAIGPSAAGTTTEMDSCPVQFPYSAIVLHSRNDGNFPGYGRKVIQYLIKCAGCGVTPLPKLPNGCVPYGGCKDGMDFVYCDGDGLHNEYPMERNPAMLDFFDAHVRKL